MSLKKVHHAATERGKYISNNSCRVRGKLLVCDGGGREERERERERGAGGGGGGGREERY